MAAVRTALKKSIVVLEVAEVEEAAAAPDEFDESEMCRCGGYYRRQLN